MESVGQINLVPELVEGEHTERSPRRPLRRRRGGEDWDMAFLIPFGKLRDRIRQKKICEILLLNNAETSVNPYLASALALAFLSTQISQM